MSAESPRKTNGRGGHVIAPQPVSDRSIIESVAGFINDVVPQAYSNLPAGEGKEAITWARFEYGDINDPALYPDTADDRSSTPPLLLVLGYNTGAQVWAIPANGEATEVLSWRHNVVRTLRILPTPLNDSPIPDAFGHKRPLMALCANTDNTGDVGPPFCSLKFISLRCGSMVKSIKFKNPVNDVLANRRSVVVTFPERIAVFDACTLEDRLTVTTCYPSPGPNPNPVALGTRWLAYAERQFLHSRRSSGGAEGEGVQSYAATVLHAAKSLGKGLRELGETVASSLTGSTGVGGVPRASTATSGSPGTVHFGVGCDVLQHGVVTILDAQGVSSSRGDDARSGASGPFASNADLMIAHFAAHNEPIVALQFDPSGMLILTADKRGHDFHVFRIHPHPGGSALAAVHHLYILHRGDTTAKVQDIAFAADSRWVAVSTQRGTTHVFPITPYGGPVGIRTHTTPHVVNRLSRFHRSAGLTADGRNSPVPTACSAATAGSYETSVLCPAMPYLNPRLPPYPHPTVINPLAQIRRQITHTLLSGMAPMSPVFSQQGYHRNPTPRVLGRSQSVSDDGASGNSVLLRVTACFAAPRAWLVGSPTVPRETSNKSHKRAMDSLFVMTCSGSLIEYDLEPKHVTGIPKEKICDDTAIELEVKAKAQWLLLRSLHSLEIQPPLPTTNPLMVLPDHLPPASESRPDDADERWLSQVEIVTHAGPHRRLWMGPQFTFKTYTSTSSGSPLSLLEMEAVEVGTSTGTRPARSNPVNMPLSGRPIVPVLIESGSASSYEQSPRLMETYGGDGDSDGSFGPGDNQLKEDLADAMMESPGVPLRDAGRRTVSPMHNKRSPFPIEKVVNPVGTVITVAVPSDDEAASLPSLAVGSQESEHLPSADVGKVDVNVVRWPTVIKHYASSEDSGSVLLTSTQTKNVHRTATSLPSKKVEAQWPKNTDILQSVPEKLDSKSYAGVFDFQKPNSSECHNRIASGESIQHTVRQGKDGTKFHNDEKDNEPCSLPLSSGADLCSKTSYSSNVEHKTGKKIYSSGQNLFSNTEISLTSLKNIQSEPMSINKKLEKYDLKKNSEINIDNSQVKSEEKTNTKKKRISGKKKVEDSECKETDSLKDQCRKESVRDEDTVTKLEQCTNLTISNKVHKAISEEEHYMYEVEKFGMSLEERPYVERKLERHQKDKSHLKYTVDQSKSDVKLSIKAGDSYSDCSVSVLPSFQRDENHKGKDTSDGDGGTDGDTIHDTADGTVGSGYGGSDNITGGERLHACKEIKELGESSERYRSKETVNLSIKLKEKYDTSENLNITSERNVPKKRQGGNISKEKKSPSLAFFPSLSETACAEEPSSVENDTFSKVEVTSSRSCEPMASPSRSELLLKDDYNNSDDTDGKPNVWYDTTTGLRTDLQSDDLLKREKESKKSANNTVVPRNGKNMKEFCDLKEDSKNNNEMEEKLFAGDVSPLSVSPTSLPVRSWSSIVSTPKPGTNSSTDDGSGEYDSNESKESTDLRLDELEERPSSKSASSEMVTASESLSASSYATPLEEEASNSLCKIFNEEDGSNDLATLSSISTKKNRKTKKKRR